MAVTSDVYPRRTALPIADCQSPYDLPRTDAEWVRRELRPSLTLPSNRGANCGELDWIVRRRSEGPIGATSVEQLRDDVHSYLSGRSVRAAPDCNISRAKFSCALTAVAAEHCRRSSMLAGLRPPSGQARVARAERAAPSSLRRRAEPGDSFLFKVRDAIAGPPRSTPSASSWPRRGVLDSLARDADDRS
jgi:hypothetical protein